MCFDLSQNDLDDPERGMIFVCSATHKTKSMFFFLAQTEQGDIFKVTLETDEEMVSMQGQELFIIFYDREDRQAFQKYHYKKCR